MVFLITKAHKAVKCMSPSLIMCFPLPVMRLFPCVIYGGRKVPSLQQVIRADDRAPTIIIYRVKTIKLTQEMSFLLKPIPRLSAQIWISTQQGFH